MNKMNKDFCLLANWKMNHSPESARAYVRVMLEKVPPSEQNRFVFLAPAFTLPILQEELKGSSFGYGAQNCHFEDKGPFTGENSPLVLKKMGATHGLTGHSERRELFFEESLVVQKKAKALIKHSLQPVICVGENLEERKKGQTFSVLEKQISPLLDLQTSLFHIAYEPVWAIGSGKPADEKDIAEVREYIQKLFLPTGLKPRFLYGGSVNTENARALSQIDGVEGFLVGGHSLNANHFLRLYQSLGLS